MKKIKSILTKIITSCVAFFAAIPSYIVKALYMEPQELYGPPPDPKSSVSKMESNFNKAIFIPVIFIAGSIVYFKKSKSSTKKKAIIIIISAIIAAIAFYGVSYIF